MELLIIMEAFKNVFVKDQEKCSNIILWIYEENFSKHEFSFGVIFSK